MKYKILLAGKNQTTIDDFFYAMSDEFECLTTSIRNVDIDNHINYFQPDALVYCMSTETRENILKLINALEMIDRKNLNLILVGDSEPCYEFMNLKPEMVRLMLLKPIAASVIKSELVRFFEEKRKIREQMIHEEMEKRKKAEESVKHILVVDDDPMMLRLLKNELKDEYNIAKQIGAFELSEKAARMEKAGNECDAAIIHQYTDKLLYLYLKYADILKEYFNEEVKESWKVITSDELKEYFVSLREAAEELDMDKMDEILSFMAEYRYDSTQKIFFGQLKESVAEYDVNKCEEVIKEWEECL